MTAPERPARRPLEGVRVADLTAMWAGPYATMVLADFGADVIKIEHPRGDPIRDHGHAKDGVPLWWKVVGRNKQAVTLNLSKQAGQEVLLKLAERSDVLIENFRPGTLERWNLSPQRLRSVNPGLIITRVTGFGQFGPYSSRPGFGTLAESMSGFAHMTGEPEGPPTLPPFGLADSIAAQATTNAILMCLYNRDARSGAGQTIDVAIIEPILTVLGSQPTVYDQLGIIQRRSGNRSVNNAPRNTYEPRDGYWVAISTSAQSVAERVMRLVGRPELIEEPWFASGRERARYADLLDDCVGSWIRDRDLEEVIAAFEEAEAAVAPIYDAKGILNDPQYRALESIVTVEDPELGQVKMQNVMFRLSRTPGHIRWAGRELGADNRSVYTELGLSKPEIDELAAAGVI